MARVVCDIYLYPGRWQPRDQSTWPEVIREALGNAFDCDGCIMDVTFHGVEDSSDGRRLAFLVDAEWWGNDPGDCRDVAHEALSECLIPQYESQIEVEVTCVSDPDDMDYDGQWD